MSASAQIHYEVFFRRTPTAPWALEAATESRERAVETAEALIAERRANSVRVSKETMDPATGEFQSVFILTLGDRDSGPKKKQPERNPDPPCVSAADLYTSHARERIGRLLQNWLARMKATPFELLHRPDLAEQLEASDAELRHAVQRIAIPEAQARGVSVHAVMRSFTGLAEKAIEKLIKDGKRAAFPDLRRENLAAAAERLLAEPDRVYLLGGAVAAALASAADWSGKTARLLDLADSAPAAGPARSLALSVLEQPLAEIVGEHTGMADLLGRDLDLGGALAALIRLTAGRQLEALLAVDPTLRKHYPPLSGPAVRLASWFDAGVFGPVRNALSRRILSELTGPRRLRPSDAEGEIQLLRALAMGLTASAGEVISPEDVQAAFVERSRRLVAADFVEAYLGPGRSALDEATALLWLAENVTGGANKRAASRWLNSAVSALRFETEMRTGPDSPPTKLQRLAELQRGVIAAGLDDVDAQAAIKSIGEAGGWIESDCKLTAKLARAPVPALNRLTMLLKLASGEAGPVGPASERARGEADKLLRDPAIRAELGSSPDAVARVRALLDTAKAA